MEKLKSFRRLAIAVSLLLLFSTLGAWSITKSVAERETTRLFNEEVNVIESWITNRFELYKTIAYGLQAFWAGSEIATQEEWQTYVETLKIKERFPGITSVGLAKRIDDNYIATFVYPPEREAVIGANIATEERRLQAINQAVDNASCGDY